MDDEPKMTTARALEIALAGTAFLWANAAIVGEKTPFSEEELREALQVLKKMREQRLPKEGRKKV